MGAEQIEPMHMPQTAPTPVEIGTFTSPVGRQIVAESAPIPENQSNAFTPTS